MPFDRSYLPRRTSVFQKGCGNMEHTLRSLGNAS